MIRSAIFLPGMLCDERVWEPVVRLLPASVDATILDLRDSDTLEDMLARVGQAMMGPSDLVGFSMGGYVAQEFAVRFPARVRRLAIFGASGDGLTDEQKNDYAFGKNVARFGLFKGLPLSRVKEFVHPSRHEDRDLLRLVQSMSGGPDASKVFFNQISATLERRSLRAELGKLGLPTLVVGGAQDRIVPIESVRSLAEAVPGSEFHALEACGHFITLEQTEKSAGILARFLTA